MALFEKKQQLGQGKSEKIPPPKEEKKDTSGLGGKPYLTREEFRHWLRKPEHYPSTGLPETERVKLEKELFGLEYGSYIEKGEPEKALKKLEMAKFKAKNQVERVKIEKEIKLLKRFLGKS